MIHPLEAVSIATSFAVGAAAEFVAEVSGTIEEVSEAIVTQLDRVTVWLDQLADRIDPINAATRDEAIPFVPGPEDYLTARRIIERAMIAVAGPSGFQLPPNAS